MDRIVFLGSGGGRYMLGTQMRRTGGLYAELGGLRFGIDPGPGALVHAAALGLEPGRWNGLLVSHHHIDHVSDANAVLDAMVNGDSKQKNFPFLVCEQHCVSQGKGKDDPYPYITKYHQGLVKKLLPVKAGDSVAVGSLQVKAVKANHYAHNIGFVISHGSAKIGYAADGSYYSGQEKHFEGCDVLVLNVPWPKGYDAPSGIHMTLDDAISLVRALQQKPKLVIIAHLAPAIIRANLFKQERIFRDAAKCSCIIAEDFMELDLDTMKTKILQAVTKI